MPRAAREKPLPRDRCPWSAGPSGPAGGAPSAAPIQPGEHEMRKLKLDIDHLAVESFEPAPGLDGEGTVVGHITARTNECGGECPTGALGYTCVDCNNTGYEGGTMDRCTYAPTMNPALFECYSMAYCIATKPCP
jgi:hypothetical protein